MARELAVREYTAAASLRAAAINDEVRALRAAIAELARAPGGRGAGDRDGGEARAGSAGCANRPKWDAADPAVALVLALVLVFGAVLGAALTKRSYAGWQPPHGRRGAAALRLPDAWGAGGRPRARAVLAGGAHAGAGREGVDEVSGAGEGSLARRTDA